MTAHDLALDYFQIYDVVNKEAAGEVLLRGAFDVSRQKMRLALLDYFATPVSKDGEPYVDRHAHLPWYRGIQGPEPVRAVTLENTFGKLKIRTATGLDCSCQRSRSRSRARFQTGSITTRCTAWRMSCRFPHPH